MTECRHVRQPLPPTARRGDRLTPWNTDVTGPADAAKGIVVVFDIFGFKDQTIQGADILATSDDHQKYRVFMPDWFDGEPCPVEWFVSGPTQQASFRRTADKRRAPGIRPTIRRRRRS